LLTNWFREEWFPPEPRSGNWLAPAMAWKFGWPVCGVGSILGCRRFLAACRPGESWWAARCGSQSGPRASNRGPLPARDVWENWPCRDLSLGANREQARTLIGLFNLRDPRTNNRVGVRPGPAGHHSLPWSGPGRKSGHDPSFGRARDSGNNSGFTWGPD